MRHVSNVIMMRGSMSEVSVCWGGVFMMGKVCAVRILGRMVYSISMYCSMCCDDNA